MSRSSTAEVLPEPQILPPVRPWRDTLFRRARSALANAFFESLSATGRLHPAASPWRHGVELESDVVYGDDRAHVLDIYRPVSRAKPWPVVFYVHGGAFHLLSKDTHWLMGLVFARFGYLVINVNYRLAPKHPFPAAIEDTCRAFTWTAERIRELGGDPDRVAVAGESAGGNLITSLALASIWRRPEPWARAVYDCGVQPRAVLPFCAMLQVSETDRFRKRRALPWWVDGMIRDAGASYLHGHPHVRSSATALADPLVAIEDAANGEIAFERPVPPFSHLSGRGIPCSTTPAASKKRSPRSTPRAKRVITRAVFMRSTRSSGIRPLVAAGAMRSHFSIATCGSCASAA